MGATAIIALAILSFIIQLDFDSVLVVYSHFCLETLYLIIS